MTTFEYVKNLGQGWNLGNTLDSVLRQGETKPQETAWGNPKTTQEMIRTVKDAGFEIFRVPVTWFQKTGGAPDFTINKEFLSRVKEVVDYGINIGMAVILNLHHENWHFPSEENFPAAKERMKKVWTQIANYFADYSEKLIFEAMNEPRKENTDVEWTGGDEEGRRVVMKLNQVFVDTIRATGGKNATRMLLVPNYAASCNENAMEDFIMPKGENIIMSLHGYVPWDFALGGDHKKNIWSEAEQPEIDHLFARVQKYFLAKKIPVIMGECGARKKYDNAACRAKWAAYYTAKAREYGVPCCWWDNGHLDGSENTEVFGLLNRDTLQWGYPEIVKAFVGR
ncbi:MAG: glycoside hydrolase family 5 protein [Defluviitaleaceae bacterium]|nr:glycoside hydrolase family 5 protein [Defluviitaleaceae bacterium]MCL2264095.1 glycoside hydrolase family 5 protein [Defluviitaleaceae bacterium]